MTKITLSIFIILLFIGFILSYFFLKDTGEVLNEESKLSLPSLSVEVANETINIEQEIINKQISQKEKKAIVVENSINRKYKNALHEIKAGNYSNIDVYHYVNILCASVSKYDDETDYLSDNADSSNLSYEDATQVYQDCLGIKVDSFKERESQYLKAISEGSREAEFYLALLYPPSFKNRYKWLTNSAVWNEQSLPLISQSLDNNFITKDKKLFWGTILNNHFNDEKHDLLPFEEGLNETTRMYINDLAQEWISATTEQSKRDIIFSLNTYDTSGDTN